MFFSRLPRRLLIIFSIIITTVILTLYLSKSFSPTSQTYTQSSSTIITQLQTIGRLETASYSIETIIEAGQTPGNVFQNILFSDKLLLIAHGQVTAGFDLTQLTSEDIQISNNQLTLTLPPPQILTVNLDNAKTRVYDRQQGFLTAGNKDLESQARQAAENQIRQAACEGDILDAASQSAKSQLTALLKGYFQNIIINIPSVTC